MRGFTSNHSRLASIVGHSLSLHFHEGVFGQRGLGGGVVKELAKSADRHHAAYPRSQWGRCASRSCSIGPMAIFFEYGCDQKCGTTGARKKEGSDNTLCWHRPILPCTIIQPQCRSDCAHRNSNNNCGNSPIAHHYCRSAFLVSVALNSSRSRKISPNAQRDILCRACVSSMNTSNCPPPIFRTASATTLSNSFDRMPL